MDAVVHIVDFWFWALVPAVMLIGVVSAIPAAVILGLMVTGHAREERRGVDA